MIAAISKPVWLFLGIAAVLLVATAVAEVLRWRLHGRSSSVVDNLVARIRAWWVMALVGASRSRWGALA